MVSIRLRRRSGYWNFMLNALRLVEGFPAGLFSERTGLPLQRLLPLLNQAKERELLEWNAHFIRPTELGRRFLNDLLELFLPEAHYACDSIKGQSTLETRTS